jgi:hypothetical protein
MQRGNVAVQASRARIRDELTKEVDQDGIDDNERSESDPEDCTF